MLPFLIISQLAFIFLILRNVCSTDGKARLTNAKEFPGLQNVPAKTQDQCLPQPGHEHIKPYTLRFFRKELKNTCDGVDDALLICYESMLDANKSHIGLVNKIPFRIKRNLSNNVTHLCEQKRLASGHKDNRGRPWNGILVSNIVQADGKQLLVVKLSLEKHPLIFEDRLQFDIVLMTKEQSFSIITSPCDWKKQRRIKRPGMDKKREQYMKNVHKGIRMSKHEGLWMLGLDMLPHFETDHQLRLFIYRACSCSMEVIFMSPTDVHEPALDKVPLAIGHKDCDQKIDQTFPIDVNHNAIAIRGFTAEKEPVRVEIFLLDEHDQSMIKVTINESSATVPGGEPFLFGNDTKLGQGKLFQLEGHIHFYEYHLILTLANKKTETLANNKTEEMRFTPNKKWWIKIPKEKIKALKLKGNFLLLHPPKFFQIGMSQESGDYYVHTPYPKKIGEMGAGGIITIKGHIYENANFMAISLLHNAPEWNPYVGATPMQLQVNFTANTSEITTWRNGKYEGDIMHFENPFKRNEAFEMKIHVLEENFAININDEKPIVYNHSMKIWNTNWLGVYDDVLLIGKPVVYIPKINATGTNISMLLPSLLRPGDSIEFAGNVPKNEASFDIYLLHGGEEFDENDMPDKFTDVVLRLSFEFGKKNTLLSATHYFQGSDGFAPKKYAERNPLTTTLPFFFIINVTKKRFECFTKNKDTGDAGEIFMTYVYEERLPEWAIDHIWITGDVLIKSGFPNIVWAAHDNSVKHVDKLLSFGDSIKLNGTVNINMTKGEGFRVSLFHEALTHNENIGETVLEIAYSPSGQFSFKSYFDKKFHPDEKIVVPVTPLVFGLKLAFQIYVLPDFYDITIEGPGVNVHQLYNHTLPVWAVQHVVVEEGFKVKGEIEIFYKNL